MPNNLIPSSPSEAEYAATFKANEPPLPEAGDPFALFAEWLRAAYKSEPRDQNAMAVATVDETGMPDVRMVLLKDFDESGFTFYTNLESAKGRQLAAQPKAALLFHWKSLSRQVRIRGAVSAVSGQEADAYFATRARDSRIGAWASDQSRPLESRFALEKKVAAMAAKFGLGQVPRPPHWSGFRLAPERFEFWRERPFRLHDRLVFTRERGAWTTGRLYP